MVINNHGFTLIEALLSLIGVVLIGLLIPKTMLEGNRVIRETQIQTAMSRAHNLAVHQLHQPQFLESAIRRTRTNIDGNKISDCLKKTTNQDCSTLNQTQFEFLYDPTNTLSQQFNDRGEICQNNCAFQLVGRYRMHCRSEGCHQIQVLAESSKRSLTLGDASKMLLEQKDIFSISKSAFAEAVFEKYDCTESHPFLMKYSYQQRQGTCDVCRNQAGSIQSGSCGLISTPPSLGAGFSTKLSFSPATIDLDAGIPEKVLVSAAINRPADQYFGRIQLLCDTGSKKVDLTSLLTDQDLTLKNEIKLTGREILTKDLETSLGSNTYRLNCELALYSSDYETQMISLSRQWVNFYHSLSTNKEGSGNGEGGGNGDGSGGGLDEEGNESGSGSGHSNWERPDYNWP